MTNKNCPPGRTGTSVKRPIGLVDYGASSAVIGCAVVAVSCLIGQSLVRTAHKLIHLFVDAQIVSFRYSELYRKLFPSAIESLKKDISIKYDSCT